MPNWPARMPRRSTCRSSSATWSAVARDAGAKRKQVAIEFKVGKLPQGAKGYFVVGHDLRLGQVITNLIENARSFVPEDTGRIVV